MSMRKGPPMAPGRSGQRPDSECCEPEVAAVYNSEFRGGTVMVDRREGHWRAKCIVHISFSPRVDNRWEQTPSSLQ